MLWCALLWLCCGFTPRSWMPPCPATACSGPRCRPTRKRFATTCAACGAHTPGKPPPPLTTLPPCAPRPLCSYTAELALALTVVTFRLLAVPCLPPACPHCTAVSSTSRPRRTRRSTRWGRTAASPATPSSCCCRRRSRGGLRAPAVAALTSALFFCASLLQNSVIQCLPGLYRVSATVGPSPPSSALHTGQAGGRLKSTALRNHRSTHSRWKLCPQRSARRTSPTGSRAKQGEASEALLIESRHTLPDAQQPRQHSMQGLPDW